MSEEELKAPGRMNGKFKIKEELNMIDAERWRPTCDGKTMGYIVNDKPKAHYKPYNKINFNVMEITKVIFNPPATIVFWADGCKTVVKCGPDDNFNPHVGIAMCVMKKVYGGHYIEVGKPKDDGSIEVIWADNFHSIFRKWADPWAKEQKKEAYKPSAVAPDVILKGLSDRMNIALYNYWKNILKNFESASEDQKAEDDKEK